MFMIMFASIPVVNMKFVCNCCESPFFTDDATDRLCKIWFAFLIPLTLPHDKPIKFTFFHHLLRSLNEMGLIVHYHVLVKQFDFEALPRFRKIQCPVTIYVMTFSHSPITPMILIPTLISVPIHSDRRGQYRYINR